MICERKVMKKTLPLASARKCKKSGRIAATDAFWKIYRISFTALTITRTGFPIRLHIHQSINGEFAAFVDDIRNARRDICKL